MKRFLIVLCVALLIITICFPIIASAETNSTWVYDSEDCVTVETEQYIDRLNNDVFSQYEANPRLAIMVIDRMPEDIDNYAKNLFREYDMGGSEENYDVLIIMAIKDKLYKIESGNGYEQNKLITQDLNICMFDEDMKNILYTEDYDKAVLEIAKKFEKMMSDQDDGTYAKRDAEIAKRVAIAKPIILVVMLAIMVACVGGFIIGEKKKDKQKQEIQETKETQETQSDSN